MNIDALTFQSIAKHLLPHDATLTRDEAEALVHTAQLAGGADLDEDPDELRVQRQLVEHVCAAASIGSETVLRASPLPIDDEERRTWVARLAPRLEAPGVAELAFVIAHVVTVADLQLSPVESAFVEQLRDGLGISRDRAAELAVLVSSLITPGVEPTAWA